MAIDYSDDDMMDYNNDDSLDDVYDEDRLSDEDFDKLNSLLPKLKEKVKDYQLSDSALKESLWLNYFDLNNTINEIKDKYKPREGTNKKLSKLQLIALRKKQEREQNNPSSFPYISTVHEDKSSQSGLAKLLSKRKLESDNVSDKIKTQKTGLAALLAKKRLSKTLSSNNSISDINQSKVGFTEKTKLKDKTIEIKIDPPTTLPLSLPKLNNDHLSFSRLQKNPNHILSQIMFSEPNINNENKLLIKKRKLENDLDFNAFFTNNPTIAKKISINFNKPSPDEKRQNIEKLSKEVSKFKISNERDGKNDKPKKIAVTKPKQKLNISEELSKKELKPNLSFIVIGHVDSGKSTIIGRLLYDLNIVDSKTLHKLTKESEESGKGSFALAWIMDQTKEERSRGVTIDICQTQFETNYSRFTVIDSPGHKDYVPQMINGVTQADIAVVIIDAISFESGFNINGQTNEHLTIAKSLGIEKCIIVINKMDANDWSKDKFEFIKEQLNDFLIDELFYKKENLIFIPASGFLGDNIVKKSKNCTWYHGKTLIELLESENKLINHKFNRDSKFILTINDIQETSKSDELLISGRISSGLAQPGESIIISPSQETAVIDSIAITKSVVGSSITKHDLQKLAIEGEFIELKLKKFDNIENIKIGDIITKVDNPIKPVKSFKCELHCFNIERPLLIGTPFILFRGNVSIPSRLSKIYEIELANGKVNKKRKHLSSKNRGLVDIEILDRELPMLTFVQNGKLGRLVIRKDGVTVGAGKIIELH